MRAMADCAATLGSHFNLIFDPESMRVYQHAYGDFPGRPLQLTAGVELPDGRLACLPFRDAEAYFEQVEFFPSLTGLIYRGVQPEMALELTLSVRAPFYPHDVRLSTAPFYYLKATVRRLAKRRWAETARPVDRGRIVLSVETEGLACESLDDGLSYRMTSVSELKEHGKVTDRKEYETVSCLRGLDDFELHGESGLCVPFDLSGAKKQSLSALWSGWSESAVLEVHGKPSAFKYRALFDSEAEMAAWACSSRGEIERRCRFLDGVFRDCSLGSATEHMSAYALHSFLANTWWTVRESGEDWFSVWSGPGAYHSPVDVEYNHALFYLNLWPQLLDMLLCQWAEFEMKAEGRREQGSCEASFLCRDMGAKHLAGRQVYSHYMEVEANADYLLLMAARTFFTGDLKLPGRLLPLCRRLAAFIIDTDTDGDGLPDRSVANTVDDAGAALQYAAAQSYLGVKVQAAMWAMGELEDLAPKRSGKGHSERWKAFAAKGARTLNEKGWLKDHYVVTLNQTTGGMVDPWTGEPLPDGELKGWDDYSIYTANGLLYLFAANIKMPRWNHMRMAADIKASEAAAETRYGSAHRGGSERSVWFSQNLWRDYVAAYYGMDFLHKIQQYRDYQQIPNSGTGPSMFRDSIHESGACVSSRGVVVFGAFMAAAGLRINRVEGEICLAPLRRTLRVPVPALADWERMRVPRVIAETWENVTTVRITERDIFGGLKLLVEGAELEEA